MIYLAWHLATYTETTEGFAPPFKHQLVGLAGTQFEVESGRVKIWSSLHEDSQKLLQLFNKKLKSAPVMVTAFGSNFGIPVINTNFAQHFVMPVEKTTYFSSGYQHSDLYLHVDIAKVFSDFFANGTAIKFSDITTTLGLAKRPKLNVIEAWEAGQHKKIEAALILDSALIAISFLRLGDFIGEHAPPSKGNFKMQQVIAGACADKVKRANKLFADLL